MNHTTRQSLRFHSVELEASNARPAPYFLAGKKLYAIGTTNGALEPVGAEHLVGEMGGVWAHPVKFLDGWYLAVEDENGRDNLLRCLDFDGHLSDVLMHFRHGPLCLTRTDFVVEDDAALFSLLRVSNDSDIPWTGKLGFVAEVNILPSWFSGWERGGMELLQDHGVVVAFDKLWQGRWGVVFGSSTSPTAMVFGKREQKPTAELRYDISLQPGEAIELEFLVTCDHQNGHSGALQLWSKLTGCGAELLEQKRQRYDKTAFGGVTLQTPDEQVNDDWVLAKINLKMMEADYGPYLPGFLLAGIPEFPQLFSCDNTYTVPGATASGFALIMRSTLSLLGDYARRACGRVPHEITTNGRIFNPGNTQETPQLAIAVWDYVRWTGDLPFLRIMYPLCREGVMEYLPSIWDWDGDGYPAGDAMVERTGMGSLKLDSACYLYAAWQALAKMARVLQHPEADEYEQRAGDWLSRFERDWWIEHEGLYADSLHSDYRPQLDGHWTQVVPIQLGIARPERAERVLDTIEAEFVNRWGLVHTRDVEERVWTLPTGLLALAAARYGRAELALRLLNNIAVTARYGMLGAFKELIPEGLCFVQLWSSGLYLQGVIEGLLGLDPCAHEHRLSIAPALPGDWPAATIRHLQVGAHRLTINVAHDGCRIQHIRGPQPLHVSFKTRQAATRMNTTEDISEKASIERLEDNSAVSFIVHVGQTANLQLIDGLATVSYIDHRQEEVETVELT
jgi:hypothetical protein